MELTPKQLTNFWAKVNKRPDGIWEWTGSKSHFGHGRIMLFGKVHFAHRVSWELAHGPIPKGMCVLHKNDIPYDINTANLELGNKIKNAHDRSLRGRTSRTHQGKGENNNQAILTEQDVKEIRWLYASGLFTQKEIALAAGVHRVAICDIIRRRNWKHI